MGEEDSRFVGEYEIVTPKKEKKKEETNKPQEEEEDKSLQHGGPGSGWTAEDGHVPGSQGGTGEEAPKKEPSPKKGKIGKMNLGKIKDKQYRNDIKTQLAELTEKTGVSIDNVGTYTEEHERWGRAYGVSNADGVYFRDDATKEVVLEDSKVSVGNIKDEIKVAKTMLALAEKDGDQKKIGEYKMLLRQYQELDGYEGSTYGGNGTRHPNVDHEFAHSLARTRISAIAEKALSLPMGTPDEKIFEAHAIARAKTVRIIDVFDKCKDFCKEKKFSFYGATSDEKESFAEVYSYWKGGNPIPKDLERDFLKLERDEEI